jgi:phenylacetate-CoA ligase
MLEHTVAAATRDVPYYREQRGSNDWSNDFSAIPILQKSEIRNHFEQLISDTARRDELVRITTSGSTGTPLAVLHDSTCKNWIRTTEDYYLQHMLGFDQVECSSVVFWASTLSVWGARRNAKKRFSLWLTRTILLGASRITPREMQENIAAINSHKPFLIKGYTSTFLELVRYIRANKIAIHQPRLIVSTAETLYPEARALIEETFNCPIYDLYGARETGPVAGQCTSGKMHVFSFNVLAEIAKENGEHVLAGEDGIVLLTSLHNPAMPLLRYSVGDAAIAGKSCPCGSSLPVWEKINGRITDYFPVSDGSLVYGGYFNTMLTLEKWIISYRVTQKSMTEVEIQFISTVEPSPEKLAELDSTIKFAMGPECRIRWIRVDEIPEISAGKRVHVISLVEQQRRFRS